MNLREGVTTMEKQEKALTRAFSWLKAPSDLAISYLKGQYPAWKHEYT